MKRCLLITHRITGACFICTYTHIALLPPAPLPFFLDLRKMHKKHIPLPQNGEISTTEVALLTFLDSFHPEKPEIKSKRR